MHNRCVYSYETDGHTLPTPVAAHPALELCNTVAGWDLPPGRRKDYLDDYAALVVFARERGLLEERTAPRLMSEARRHPQRADEVLRRTRTLRADLHAVATESRAARAFERVARLAQEARSDQRLRRRSDCPPAWCLQEEGLCRPLLLLALAAADLATGGLLPTVCACPGAGCGWLFLNPSGRRKWCDMAVCGNRAKVRAHSERTRQLAHRS